MCDFRSKLIGAPMFSWFKRKPFPPLPEIYRLLFADLSLDQWLALPGANQAAMQGAGPWQRAAKAKASLVNGDKDGAIAVLQEGLQGEGQESRTILQTWQFLRALGVEPPVAEAKRVYGAVLEVPTNGGLDVLAAYSDHRARYLNYSGSAIFWESPQPAMSEKIDAFLAAAQKIADEIGPWEGARRPAPVGGHARITMLTPSGLHFGEAKLSVLMKDGMALQAVLKGSELMEALVGMAKKPNK